MLPKLKKQLPSSILMILILCIGSAYLFQGTMDKYPAYVHAWTQSDRIAIAQNFQKNGFDFFHPATYNLLTKDGITRVDFPIHDYAVAFISFASNKPVVNVFHWYNLFYSIIGLFFLFHLFLLFSKSPTRSILGTTFIFTLPFFVYYQNGFLPSTASFSNLIIGLFLIFSGNSKKQFSLGILFVTLAALARAPFFIFLFALLCIECLQGFRRKKFSIPNLIKIGVGIVVFVVYYFYNQHLGEKYGSMFLSETLHFTSFSNFINVAVSAYDRWSAQWLSPFHGILLVLLIGTSIYQVKHLQQVDQKLKTLLSYLLISAFGVSLFFIAFGNQFTDHDYYYIDSFLPLLSFWIIFMLSSIKISQKWYTFVAAGSLIFFFYFFGYAKDVQKLRYTAPFDDSVEYAYKVYKSSTADLKTWNVTEKDTLYVIDANSTNIPFTLWETKGYTNLSTRAAVLGPELDSNFTYATLVDSFFYSHIYRDYPQIINRLEKLEGNGQLSLYKKSSTNNSNSFFDELHYDAHTDFESKADLQTSAGDWLSLEQIDKDYGNSLKIDSKNEYALTLRDTIRNKQADKLLRVQFSADYFQNDTSRMQIVFSLGEFYGTRYTVSELKKIGEWEKHQFSFWVNPSQFKNGDRWSIYIWNPDNNELFIDNTNLIIFQ